MERIRGGKWKVWLQLGKLKREFLSFKGLIIGTLILISLVFCFIKKQTKEPFLNPSQEVFYNLNNQTSLTWDTKKIDSPDLNLIEKNSILEVSPPIFISPQVLGSLEARDYQTRNEILEYIVEPGDTLSGIAKNFNISLNTILWANDLNQSSTIKPGQKLIILPVSGILHYVKKGDTLSEIAQTYKAKLEEIVAFNELSGEDDIFVGDILIVPNGKMPQNTTQTSLASHWVPVASSYFICPITPPCALTQGLHWYNAVDLSHGKCGEAIFAAAGGTVQRVRYGWNRGAGNYLTILHPNGVVTMYGHLQTILVKPGQKVNQGQIIALMGGKPGTPGAGRSTGCHLHFGVYGGKNPFAY